MSRNNERTHSVSAHVATVLCRAWPLRITVGCVLAGAGSPGALAQYYWGGRGLGCDGAPSSENVNIPLVFSCGTDARDLAFTKIAGCISLPPAPAGDESAHWDRRNAPGLVAGSTRAQVVALPNGCATGGNASSNLLNRVEAEDLIFYNRNDPNLEGAAEVTMKVEFRGRVGGSPPSSCGPGHAEIGIRAGTTASSNPFSNFSANLGAFGSSGITDGPLASYANDDSPFVFSLPPRTRSFNVPYRIGLELRLFVETGTCGPSGDVTVMDAHGTLSLPTSGPVFDLPPDITCRSAQLRIVDNRWLGPCWADFNCSGSISVQDIFDLLAAYFAGDFSTDFNNSGTVSVQDIFDFLAAYFAGC